MMTYSILIGLHIVYCLNDGVGGLVVKNRICCLQLFHLPAKKNVETVLEDYANYKKSKGRNLRN